jgi:hypothetical protein
VNDLRRQGWSGIFGALALAALGCGGGAGQGPAAGADGATSTAGATGGGGAGTSGGAGATGGDTGAAGQAGATATAGAGGATAGAGGGTAGAGGGAGAADHVDAGAAVDVGAVGVQPELGDWVGLTAQGNDILFKVGADGLMNVTVFYDGNGCSAGLGDFSITDKPVAPISGGAFVDQVKLTGGSVLGTYEVKGMFTSPASASGTLTYALTGVGSGACGGTGSTTWTAHPKGDGGVPCHLKSCGGTTQPTFAYSCGGGSVTRESQITADSSKLKVTFGNGHVVNCEIVVVDGGRRGTCSDDTGVSCAW